MMGEMINYLKTTHTTTALVQPTISATKLQNMYINSASQFTDNALNTSGIQLKDETNNTFQFVTETEANFIEAEAASITAASNPTTTTASNGTKGKLISPARAILVNANGFEYKELVEKGLMGAILYDKAMNKLNNISAFDNTTIVNNQTAQEKAWDEAFGYFGVPVDYPANTTGLQHLGKYANDRNALLGNSTAVMNAFIKGRAAINNADNATVNEQVVIIRENVERGVAGTAVHYINSALANISDAPTLHHNLSEGYFLIKSLKYNPAKKISDTQIQTLINYFGGNFYTISTTDLQAAKDLLSSIYGFDAVKNQL